MNGQSNNENCYKGKKVGVLAGGLSSEREISIKSGKAVHKALTELGYNCSFIEVNRNLAEILKHEKIEVVFNALHGGYGEDGCVQGLCELLNIPYTGSSVLGASISFDKVATRRVLQGAGIPVAEGVVLHKNQKEKIENIFKKMGKVVVKPSASGSTVGVTIVKQESQWDDALKLAFEHSEQVIVERFLDGKEFSVPVHFNQAVGVIEIVPASQYEFFDYESKYTAGGATHIYPAHINDKLTATMKNMATRVHNMLNCHFYSRVDIMLDKNENPFVLELNSLPGMTEVSLFPEVLQKNGITFAQCVESILNSAKTHIAESHR